MKFLAEKLDLFSPKPELKVEGKSKFGTKFGVLMGLISITILISIYVFYIYEWLSRNKINVTFNRKRNLTPKIILNKKKISLSVFDGYGIDYPEQDRLFSISAKYWKTKFIDKSSMDSSYMSDVEYGKITEIPLKKCNKFKDDSFSIAFTQLNFLKPNSVCLELDDFEEDLFGRYGSLDK